MALEKQFVPTDPIVEQVLDKTNRLVVPRFQRVYSWKEGNLNEFYDDFIATKNQSHQTFLGTLVFDASDDNYSGVIDGQQRIITLTILLAVIRDLLREEVQTPSAYELASTIHNEHIQAGSSIRQRSIGVAESGGSIYILTAEKSMREFFEFFISKGDADLRSATKPNNEGERNVYNAYNYLRTRIKKEKLTDRLDPEGKVVVLRKLTESLLSVQFILISVYNSDMAYALFESHNAKGADLLVSDLVKSYFYGQLKGPEDTKEKRIKQWDNSVKKLKESGGIKIDKFLHYYQQSYDGKFTKAQLYSRIKSKIGKDEASAIKFIKDLEINVDLLLQLKTGEIDSTPEYPIPYESREKINASLTYISEFRVDQCYILLLSIFRNRKKFTPTYLKKIVELIENFTFVYSKISKGQANVLERVYALLAQEIEDESVEDADKAREIFSGKKYSKLQSMLSEEVRYDYFEPKFKDLDYTKPQQKKLIQYAFAKIEHHLNNGGSVLGIDSNLDHISPQNPQAGTKISSLHLIGNLVPIDKYSNSKLGNKNVADKVEIYKTIPNISLIRLTVDFLEEHNYLINDEVIDQRSASLADLGYNQVWKI